MARGAEGEAGPSSRGARLLAGTGAAIVLLLAGAYAWLAWTEPPPQPPKPLLTMPLPPAPQ